MAANVSQRKRRKVALANRVGDLHGWRFDLSCRRCRRAAIVPTSKLPPGLKVGEVLSKLRCEDCRLPPARAVICNGKRGYGAWQVTLAGPGALG